ncbi:MAG: hypothetical protein ABI137_06835 [Antricoccus sp.]
MSISNDAKAAAAEGAKPIYAAVGASGYAIEQTKILLAKLQEHAEDFSKDFSAKMTELREELEKTITDGRVKAKTLPKRVGAFDADEIRKAFEDASAQAISIYSEFTARGEKVFDGLSKEAAKNPVVKKMKEAADNASEQTRVLLSRGERDMKNLATDSADAVIANAKDLKTQVAKTEPVVPAKAAPARKAPTTKAAATKAPAKKAAAKSAPAKKAAAKSAPAKKAAAKSAIVKPAVATPAAVKPAVATPAAVKPAVATPAIVKPAVATPAAAKQAAAKSTPAGEK